MKTVSVKYYPIKKLNLALTASGSIPETWEELNPKQIIALAGTAKTAFDDVAYLAAMCGIRKRVVRNLSDFQRFQLNEAIELFSAEALSSRFVIPYVVFDETKYYTPKPRLKGMRFDQFIFTDTLFGIYQNTNSADDMHRFLAALCVHDRNNFDEDKIDTRAVLMARLKPEVKEALVINYQLVKTWLIKSYPFVFPESEEDPEAESKKPKPKAVFDSSSWIRIYDSLVGDDIPNRDSYAQWPVNEALRYLNRKIKENMKSKK